jgi:transcriptional regulator with GAF, ATPase, and Fis domain
MRRQGNGQLIGASAAIVELSQEIERIARSDAKVLITGESGVGKELVAHAIHQRSARAARTMVAVNCAGLPETLLESELFGHVKGSFTGAYRDKPGKLEVADGGVIFLDEVGEMSLRMQGLLLRFLETGELQKVGADRTDTRVDVRTVTATNRNLRDLVEQGQFREDLFYRLNVIHLVVPPLRERREDIPELSKHFLNQLGLPKRDVAKEFSPEALALMVAYEWPGNVRELQNMIERIITRSQGEIVVVEDLPHEVRARMPGTPPVRERRRTIADHLYERITNEHQSFWTTVYPLFIQREITRASVREIVRRGLADSHGNYKIVARKFNMEPTDYKKLLNFLRKHNCQPSFKEFR